MSDLACIQSYLPRGRLSEMPMFRLFFKYYCFVCLLWSQIRRKSIKKYILVLFWTTPLKADLKPLYTLFSFWIGMTPGGIFFFQIVLTQTKGPVLSMNLNFKSMFLNSVCTILSKLKISSPFAQRVGLKKNLPHVQRSSKILPQGHVGCGGKTSVPVKIRCGVKQLKQGCIRLAPNFLGAFSFPPA